VRIVANSYGCSTANVNACYSRQFEKAIAAFKAQGGLFIASAGNSGTNNDKVQQDSLVGVPRVWLLSAIMHTQFPVMKLHKAAVRLHLNIVCTAGM
jgi:hypothetical protein